MGVTKAPVIPTGDKPIRWAKADTVGHGPKSIMTDTVFGRVVIAKPRAMGGSFAVYVNDKPLSGVSVGKLPLVKAQTERYIIDETKRHELVKNMFGGLGNGSFKQWALISTVIEWTVKQTERGMNLQAIFAEARKLMERPDKHGLFAGRFYIVQHQGERRIWLRTHDAKWHMPGNEEDFAHDYADEVIGEANLEDPAEA